MLGKLLLAGLGGIVAKTLLEKHSSDEDDEINFNEFLRESYKETRKECKETLRRHLGNDIVFTGFWADAKEERELEESELLDGEVSAFTYKIGCYMIRSAQVCEPDQNAEPEMAVNVISAKLYAADDVFSNEYKYVCQTGKSESGSWMENVESICTLKRDNSVSDNEAVLFVLTRYTGSSFSADCWYKMTPEGVVTQYQEDSHDSDSYERSWWE